MDIGAKSELERMVALLNEKVFGWPDGLCRLKLKLYDRPDLDGILAFIVLTYKCETAVRNTVMMPIPRNTVMMPIPPVTICWGGGADADAACEIALKKFENGSDLISKYLPFTAGSLAELKMKAAAYYG